MAKHTFSSREIESVLPPPPYTQRSDRGLTYTHKEEDGPTFDHKRAYRLLRTKYEFRAKEAFAIAEAWSVFELAEESVRVVAVYDEDVDRYDWAASDDNPNQREAKAYAKKLAEMTFYGIGLAYPIGHDRWEPDYATFVWRYDEDYVRQATLERLPELLDEYRTAVAERTLAI